MNRVIVWSLLLLLASWCHAQTVRTLGTVRDGDVRLTVQKEGKHSILQFNDTGIEVARVILEPKQKARFLSKLRQAWGARKSVADSTQKTFYQMDHEGGPLTVKVTGGIAKVEIETGSCKLHVHQGNIEEILGLIGQ